jgi:hypothetical protein
MSALSTGLFAVEPGAPPDDVTFSGVLISEGNVHVILIKHASGRSSGWIQIGDHFDEYTVVGYSSADEKLLMSSKQGDRILHLIGGAKIAPRERTFTIGGREFEIYSDSLERNGDRLIFRGHVTGMSASGHFSCDQLTVNAKDDEMMLVGAAKFQRGNTLIRGERIRIGGVPHNQKPRPTSGLILHRFKTGRFGNRYSGEFS